MGDVMAIAFKDFHGRFLKEGGCISEPDLEPVGKTVDIANHWIAENAIKIINVETVYTNLNRQSEDSLQFEGGENRNRNAQIVRVWYLAY
jgi:hypothetical protein